MNTSYTRHCVATNELGKSYDSNQDIITTPGPPSPPIWISVTIVSTNRIDLIWNDLTNESSYTLFRDIDNNPTGAVKIGFLSNQTNYNDATLSPDTTYYYWLKAYNITGESLFSSMISNTTHPATPQAPQWINATTISTEQINLLWNDLSNETSYTLFRDTDNNPTGAVKIGIPVNQTNYPDTPLASDTKYYYWLKAYNITGDSVYSSILSNTTHPTVPTTPQWISAITISTGQINLLWNNLPNETSYTLFRDTDNNPSGAVKIGLLANQTNYSDTSLAVDTTYYYWLKAYNITGESSFSSIISNTTLPLDSTPPADITSLNISSLPCGKRVALTWINPTDPDFAGIIIVRKTGGYPVSVNDGTSVYITNNTLTSYEDTGLEINTHYYYRIYTFDDKGNVSSGVTDGVETLGGLGRNKFKVKKSAINLSRGDVMEFEYNVDPGAEVYFEIYTITGTLVKKVKVQDYRGYWQGNNKKDKDVASGFYFVMMRVNGRIVNKKPVKIGVIR